MNHADDQHTFDDIRVLLGRLTLVQGNETLVQFMRVRLEMMADRISASRFPRPIEDVMKPILAGAMKELVMRWIDTPNGPYIIHDETGMRHE